MNLFFFSEKESVVRYPSKGYEDVNERASVLTVAMVARL